MRVLATTWCSVSGFATIAAFLLLTSCGGGGGGSASSSSNGDGFTISAASLSYAAPQNGPLPPDQNIQTSVTHPEAVSAGAAYPAGVAPATWLDVQVTGSGNSWTFHFSVNTTSLAPGTYTTTVGLGIARADTSIIASRLVNISYTVSYDKLAVKLTTNLGEIYLWPNSGTPSTGLASFERQVLGGVYDGTMIHRIIPGYLIQGGEYDANYRPVSPVAPIEVDYTSTRRNGSGTVALTKTPSNTSPGFFFNLDYNYHLDITTGQGYEVIGNLDSYSRTQGTMARILASARIPNTFDGPVSSFQPTTQIRFSGNLSVGNLQTTINNVVVYDVNGAPRVLTIQFDNNMANVSHEWLVTVSDSTNTINQTGQLRFHPNGSPLTGFNHFAVMNPAVSLGAPTAIDFYFGEPGDFSNVTNFSGGTTSTIRVFDSDGRPVPDGNEQPQQGLTIQKAELLGRDRSRPNPNQTTQITMQGNLEPTDPSEDVEFEFYVGSLLVSGIDEAGIENRMRLSFANQNSVRSGQWLLTVYWGDMAWSVPQQLLFDSNGALVSSPSSILLRSTMMFDIYLAIGNIRSLTSGTPSNVSVAQMNGNSRWNQFVPIVP